MKKLNGSLLFGLLVLALGLIILANNLGFTDISVYSLLFRYWPVFIIVGGIGLLLNHGSKGEVISGVVIFLLGAALLLRNLGYLNFDLSLLFKLFWPVVLILIGVVILMGRRPSGNSNIAFMGGIERTKLPWKVEETNFMAIMGAIELDFTLAEIAPGTTEMELIAVMGGIEIKVPMNVEVECHGLAVLGGVELLNKSTGGLIANTTAQYKPETPTDKKLVFHCKAIMGGIEIKASS